MTRPGLALAIALAACGAAPVDRTASTPDLVVIRDAPGGLFAPYIEQFNTLSRARVSIRLEGNIRSAGTIFLSNPRACMAPTSRYGFHQTNWALTLPGGEAMDRAYSQMLPECLRDWYMEHGRRTFFGYTHLTAQQVHEMCPQVRICDD